MKKRSLENLQLNKERVSNLDVNTVKGGGATLTCNSVPRDMGGIGCHLK